MDPTHISKRYMACLIFLQIDDMFKEKIERRMKTNPLKVGRWNNGFSLPVGRNQTEKNVVF